MKDLILYLPLTILSLILSLCSTERTFNYIEGQVKYNLQFNSSNPEQNLFLNFPILNNTATNIQIGDFSSLTTIYYYSDGDLATKEIIGNYPNAEFTETGIDDYLEKTYYFPNGDIKGIYIIAYCEQCATNKKEASTTIKIANINDKGTNIKVNNYYEFTNFPSNNKLTFFVSKEIQIGYLFSIFSESGEQLTISLFDNIGCKLLDKKTTVI